MRLPLANQSGNKFGTSKGIKARGNPKVVGFGLSKSVIAVTSRVPPLAFAALPGTPQ